MPTLSQSQVAMYARSAGLSADRADVAAAIAMAESGGRTEAHNAVPPDDSYGLWQINMIGSMGPARRRQYGISSNTALYDPAVNARAMAAISHNGANFGPWSTYGSGAYKKFLGRADTADTGATDAVWNPLDSLGGVGDSLAGINSIAELAVGAAKWIANAHNWVRLTQVGTGALMVGVGLAIMTKGAWTPAVSMGRKLGASGGGKSASRPAPRRAAPKKTAAAPKAAPTEANAA